MSLRSGAYRFFLISRVYSVAETILVISAIVLSCVAGGLSAIESNNKNKETIAACAITAAIVQTIVKTFNLASNAERCRVISRDLNRLDKEFTSGVIDVAKRDRRYAAIQKRVPIGTCMWLR